MKLYTDFVNRVYGVISELYGLEGSKMLMVFAEGFNNPISLQSQEYATLRNKYAEVFLEVITQHADLLGISNTEYKLQQSAFYSDEVKIPHSCYPKNVKSWLSGRISRKKKCRIEFCGLIWCHAMGWNIMSDTKEAKIYECKQKLREICSDYLPKEDVENNECTFEMLWKASLYTYKKSY